MTKNQKIHEVNGEFSISSYNCWMPGCYENREAAELAFRFCDCLLQVMQDSANARNPTEGGTITMADLEAMQGTRGFRCGQGAHAPGWKDGDPLVFTDGRT